jgi:hypothetical protein
MLFDLVKDICESLDDSDICEFRKIFHIDKLISDLNAVEEIDYLKERKKTCSKVFDIALVGVKTQKEEEKYFLEFFCKLMRDEYGLHIEEYKKVERPDFIVPIAGKRIGIELTTYNTEKERRNLQPDTKGLVSIKENEVLHALGDAICKKIKKYESFRHSEEMDELKIDELWLVLYSPSLNYETTKSIVYFSVSDNSNSRGNLDSLKNLLKDDRTFELIFILTPKLDNKELYDKFFIRNESDLFKKR